MQKYTIIITNNENPNELKRFTTTAEDLETLAENLEKTAEYAGNVTLTLLDGTVLEVDQNSEHGYNANLYANKHAFEDGKDPIGGGLCTGTLSDAIEKAITCR